jgi:hypothetical protein
MAKVAPTFVAGCTVVVSQASWCRPARLSLRRPSTRPDFRRGFSNLVSGNPADVAEPALLSYVAARPIGGLSGEYLFATVWRDLDGLAAFTAGVMARGAPAPGLQADPRWMHGRVLPGLRSLAPSEHAVMRPGSSLQPERIIEECFAPACHGRGEGFGIDRSGLGRDPECADGERSLLVSHRATSRSGLACRSIHVEELDPPCALGRWDGR